MDKVFMLFPEIYKDNDTEELKLNTVKLENYISSSGNIDYKKMYAETNQRQRNSLLQRMFWESLTNSTTADLNMRLGNFEHYVKEAKVADVLYNMSISDIRKYYGIKEDVALDEEATMRLISKFSKEVNEMDNSQLSKLRDSVTGEAHGLVSLDTQLFTFTQFKVGDEMISVNAVAAAAHNIGELAKTHTSKPFNFLGYTIHDIDKIRDNEGNLISSNIAEGIGASVDNASNPTLYSLEQTKTSGNATNFLLRGGIPLKVVLKYIKAMAVISRAEVPEIDKSNKELMMQLLSLEKRLKLEDIVDISILCNNIPKIENRSSETNYKIMAAKMLYNSVCAGGELLNYYTTASRGDAESMAAGPTLGHTFARIFKRIKAVEKAEKTGWLKSNIIDLASLYDKSNTDTNSLIDEIMVQPVPFVYAATKLGEDLGTNLLLKHIKIAGLLNSLLGEDGLLYEIDPEKISTERIGKFIDNYICDYYLFLAKGTKFFGDKYEYLITNTPEQLRNLKNKYPAYFKSNAFLNSLTIKQYSDNYLYKERVEYSKDYSANKFHIENMRRDWLDLITSNNKELRDLGINLVKYGSLYGFNFVGGSIMPYLPSAVKTNVRDYKNTINTDLNNPLVGPLFESFKNQFLANNMKNSFLYTKINIRDCKISDDRNQLVTTWEKGNEKKFVKVNVDKLVDVFTYHYILTEIREENGKYVCTYTRIREMGDSKFKEYYYQEVVESTMRERLSSRNSQNIKTNTISNNNNTSISNTNSIKLNDDGTIDNDNFDFEDMETEEVDGINVNSYAGFDFENFDNFGEEASTDIEDKVLNELGEETDLC